MYLLIPVEMCSWAIRNKFIRPFQVYIQLKTMCKGKMLIGIEEMTLIADTIGLRSNRAVKNNINRLIQMNWIGFDKKTACYYIRGFEKIRYIYGFNKRTGAEFNTKDIKKFRGFIAGAVIGYLAISQRRKRRAGELKCGSSIHPARHNLQFYDVANTGIAKILKVSVSTAFSYKHLAKKEGFILVKKRLAPKGIPAIYKEHYKAAYPDEAKMIKVYDGELMVQQIDTVAPCINFRRRKKIET